MFHAIYQKEQNRDVVRELISRKAEINIQELKGSTPLIVAAMNRHAVIVGDLLENGAQVLAVETDKGQTALHIASAKNDLRTVRTIIDYCQHKDQNQRKLEKPGDDCSSNITKMVLY